MQRGDERPRKMLRSQQPSLNVNKTKEIIVDFRKSSVFRNCSSSLWKPLQCRLLSMLFPPKQCLKKVSNRMKDNTLAFSFSSSLPFGRSLWSIYTPELLDLRTISSHRRSCSSTALTHLTPTHLPCLCIML